MDNSVSNSVSGSEDVIGIIARDGTGFLSRVKAFQQARESHDKSLKALQLGQHTKQQEVEAVEKILADARRRGDEVVVEVTAAAKASAARIVGEANAKKSAVEAEIAQLRRDTEAWVRQAKADVAGKLERLRAAMRAAE